MRRLVSSGVLVLIVTFLAPACASLGRNDEPPPKPIQIEVKNNLTYPSELTVYIVSSGIRQMLGFMGPSETKTFTFTPISYAQTYRLVGQLPLSRYIRSQPFTVGSEMTGMISWTLVPNIVGFWELQADTVIIRDTTYHLPADSVQK